MADEWEARGLSVFRVGETAMAIATVPHYQKDGAALARLIAATPAMAEALIEMRAAARALRRAKTDGDFDAARERMAAATVWHTLPALRAAGIIAAETSDEESKP